MDKLVKFFSEHKRAVLIAVLIIMGIFLIFLSSSGEEETSKTTDDITLGEYKKALEEELSSLCSKIDGVGKCHVTVTFERGEQNSYKGNTLVESKPPRILGVTVVCRGGDSDRVKSEITDVMISLFDIGSNRVAVLKLA